MKKIWYFLFGILALIVLSVPIREYFLQFKDFPRSDDPAQWGQFGDYIGGTLNPLLAFFNILILIYISFKIAKLEDSRHNNEFIYRIYTEFIEKVDSINEHRSVQEIRDLTVYLKQFRTANSFLFTEIEEIFTYAIDGLSITCFKIIDAKYRKERFNTLCFSKRVYVHGLSTSKTYYRLVGTPSVTPVKREVIFWL